MIDSVPIASYNSLSDEPVVLQQPAASSPVHHYASPPRKHGNDIITDSVLKTLAPTTPRTAGPMPCSTELLVLREEYTQGGIWGIGLSIAKDPPHKVNK